MALTALQKEMLDELRQHLPGLRGIFLGTELGAIENRINGDSEPEILHFPGTLSLGTPASKVITGQGFLQGQARAAYQHESAESTLLFEAASPGSGGNALAIELVDDASASVAVNTAAGVTTVTVNFRGAGNSNTDGADEIAALIAADAAARALVSCTSVSDGNVEELAATLLSGGDGEGVSVEIGGKAQTIRAKITDTSITITTVAPTLGSPANGDNANMVIVSNGIRSKPMTVRLVT